MIAELPETNNIVGFEASKGCHLAAKKFVQSGKLGREKRASSPPWTGAKILVSRYIHLANGASRCPNGTSNHSRDPTFQHAQVTKTTVVGLSQDAGRYLPFRLPARRVLDSLPPRVLVSFCIRRQYLTRVIRRHP